MGIFSRDVKSMDDLYEHTLRDVYYAEKKILQSLPEMIDMAKNAQLADGLRHHLEETRGHVERLERVFELEGREAKGVNCPAIDGIIDEAEEISGEIDDEDVLDAAIVAAAQAVEHYEITRYGTLIAWAKELGRQESAKILQQTLEEEKSADAKLTQVAEARVNRMAA